MYKDLPLLLSVQIQVLQVKVPMLLLLDKMQDFLGKD